MNKEKFLQLFEVNEIYEKYKDKIPFSFGLHDRLIGSDTFIFFGFHEINKITLCIECVEFSETIQELEIHLLINEQQIEIDKEEIIAQAFFHRAAFNF